MKFSPHFIHCSSTITFGVLCGTLGVVYEKYKVKPTVFAAQPLPDDAPVHLPKPSASTKSISHQIARMGYSSFDNLKVMDGYILAYDRRTRSPYWVFEHLTTDSVAYNPEVDRKLCEFVEDETIHEFFRSRNVDYKGSGYDRGHLAAAGNHKSNQKTCEDTFLLTNISPQVGKGFNRSIWNKLEKYTRKLTRSYPNVYICTGPLYLPRKESDGKKYVRYEVIGKNHVAVPTHFFKVIVSETANQEFDLEAYVLPNKAISENTPLKNFRVPIEAIERAAGFLIFSKIPRSSFRKIN